ncbi:MAG: hypothetical protein LAQ30_05920 [Acidobacteriia bacterium]|nr:hypothetical protein [Terriglobia bacterium]
MGGWRSVLIGVALAAGFAVALAGPVWLLWDALQPEPWNAQNLRVRFESVRYEAGGLVFRYTVVNRTRRAFRLLPGSTRIRALRRPGLPEPGYPSLGLPLDLDARAANHVELRLEIATPWGSPAAHSLGQEWIGALPEDTSDQAAVSPLPQSPPAVQPAPPPRPFSPTDLLDALDGFELTDRRTGLKIVFPRMW